MEIESQLHRYLRSDILGDESEIELDDSLISSGRIDSLGLLKLLGFIQDRFKVDLMSSEGPEAFETIRALAEAIRRSR